MIDWDIGLVVMGIILVIGIFCMVGGYSFRIVHIMAKKKLDAYGGLSE